MTNAEIIQAIRNEIESLKSIEYPCDNSQQATGFFNALDRMTDFLDTLESEKPVPKDLEEAAEKYAYGSMPDEMKSYVKPVGDEVIKNFIAGAKWQKEQMMKEAVEHYVVSEIAGRRIGPAIVHFDENFIVGDKVRVIVIPNNTDEK